MRPCLLAFVMWLVAVPVVAQPRIPHWGVVATFTPRWTSPDLFDDLFEVTPADVRGSDFRVGVLRSKPLGPEWGVSFVHTRIDPQSGLGALVDRCEMLPPCYQEGDLYTLSDASLEGVMVHVAVPFATIRRKAQFALLLGGGVASVTGNATHDSRRLSYDALPLGFVRFRRNENGQVIEEHTIATVPASDVMKSPTPLVDVQVAFTATVRPGFKIRASGGLSLPGFQPVSVSAIYLFGMR